jgi:hypothetical protein
MKHYIIYKDERDSGYVQYDITANSYELTKNINNIIGFDSKRKAQFMITERINYCIKRGYNYHFWSYVTIVTESELVAYLL